MDLYERATVLFSRPLQSCELDGLMNVILSKVGFRSINYELVMSRQIPSPSNQRNLADEHPDLISLNMGGWCYTHDEDVKRGVPMMRFEGFRNVETDLRMIDGFRFQTTPGYEQIPPRELELMDSVRRVASEYAP